MEVYGSEGEVIRTFSGRNVDAHVETEDYDSPPSLCLPVKPKEVRLQR